MTSENQTQIERQFRIVHAADSYSEQEPSHAFDVKIEANEPPRDNNEIKVMTSQDTSRITNWMQGYPQPKRGWMPVLIA